MGRNRDRVQKTALTDEIIQATLQQAAAGCFLGRTKDEWDSESRRLVLRARERAVGFYYRQRDVTVRLGDAENIDLRDARIRAAFVHDILRQSGSVAEAKHAVALIERMKREHADFAHAMQEAAKILLTEFGGGPGRTWTWREMKDAFLANRLPQISDKWGRQVTAFLNDEAFKPLSDRLVSKLNFEDFDLVLIYLKSKRGPSAVKDIVGFVKEMLSWAAAMPRSKKSGLSMKNMWWNDIEAKFTDTIRTHTPNIQELVRTIIIVEHLTLKDAHPVSNGTLGMLWAAVLLGQRTGQLCLMTKKRLLLPNMKDEYEHDYDFVGQEKQDSSLKLASDWRIFTWSAEEMKGRSDRSLPHVLPIDPSALCIFRSFQSSSNYMYPSGKKDGPCTQSALNQLFRRLAGSRDTGHTKDKLPRKATDMDWKGQDLFKANNIRRWTPHDVRRTITSFLAHHKLGAASSAILAHREKRDTIKARIERMLPVTQLHYHHDQRLLLKAEGLSLWTKRVLEQYNLEKEIWSPVLNH